jgi:hypothetical protein
MSRAEYFLKVGAIYLVLVVVSATMILGTWQLVAPAKWRLW